jgi:hypothetical protein
MPRTNNHASVEKCFWVAYRPDATIHSKGLALPRLAKRQAKEAIVNGAEWAGVLVSPAMISSGKSKAGDFVAEFKAESLAVS